HPARRHGHFRSDSETVGRSRFRQVGPKRARPGPPTGTAALPRTGEGESACLYHQFQPQSQTTRWMKHKSLLPVSLVTLSLLVFSAWLSAQEEFDITRSGAAKRIPISLEGYSGE